MGPQRACKLGAGYGGPTLLIACTKPPARAHSAQLLKCQSSLPPYLHIGEAGLSREKTKNTTKNMRWEWEWGVGVG